MAGAGLDLAGLREAISEAETRRFLDAWLGWRGDRLVPARSAVNPADIVACLDLLTLYEVADADHVIFRLAGSRLRMANVVAFEATGRNYKDLTAPEDWPARSRRFMDMSRLPCGGFMMLRLAGPEGPAAMLECLNLPVRPGDADGQCQMICCNTVVGRRLHYGQAPRLRTVPAVEGFVYVDVGAGLPAGAGS